MGINKSKPVCLRCSGPMEPGFIRELNSGKEYASRWVSGYPKQKGSSWEKGQQVETSGKHHLVIDAYRCELCGYLELYANQSSNQDY